MNQRKHRIQMSQLEIDEMESYIHKQEVWANIGNILTRHAKSRMSQWKVNSAEVLGTIRSGKIIEVHCNAYPDVRALLRKEFGKYAVCVVVSLVRKEVVTVFVNQANDNHYTLDHSQYQWKCDLTALRFAAA